MDCLVPRRGGLFSFLRFFVSGFCILRQRRVQRLDQSIYVYFLNHIRRQKAQHGFVRAIDDNPFFEQLLCDCLGQFGRVQLHGLHQPCSTDVLNRFVLPVERFERRLKIFAQRAHVLQQFVLRSQELNGNGARQRPSAERGPMQTRMHTSRNPLCGEDGPERQTASQRLGDRDHVGQHAIMLISKVASRAAETALNLVEHEQRAALFGQAPGEFEKLRMDWTNPALTLNGLDTHSADAGITFPLQIVEIIELDETYAGHERNEWGPVFRLTGCGKRAESASMKRVLHGENAPFCLAAAAIIHLRKSAGELERAFPCLSAAIAKEGAIEPGNFGQQPRELRLILVEEKIGNMNQPAGLTFDRRLNSRMAGAERVPSDSAEEIQIALTLRIPEKE